MNDCQLILKMSVQIFIYILHIYCPYNQPSAKLTIVQFGFFSMLLSFFSLGRRTAHSSFALNLSVLDPDPDLPQSGQWIRIRNPDPDLRRQK
jgi:hypothetical protein